MQNLDAPPRSDEISDLLDQVALRDQTAFLTLFDRTSPKLFAVLIRMLGRQDAVDALQDVFGTVWKDASEFSSQTGSGIGWLLTLTRHHAIGRLRAPTPNTENVGNRHDLTASDLTSAQAVAASLNRARLDHCLGKLDARRADALRRAYLDGESYADLAERFEVPPTMMRSWLNLTLISLRTCLSDFEAPQTNG